MKQSVFPNPVGSDTKTSCPPTKANTTSSCSRFKRSYPSSLAGCLSVWRPIVLPPCSTLACSFFCLRSYAHVKHEHYVTNDMYCNLIGRTLQGAVHNFHVRFLPDPFLVAKGAGPQTSFMVLECRLHLISCTITIITCVINKLLISGHLP